MKSGSARVVSQVEFRTGIDQICDFRLPDDGGKGSWSAPPEVFFGIDVCPCPMCC
ncbi:MAG: hypothetical protein R3C99_15875 [Pirellulaceae bacterium]